MSSTALVTLRLEDRWDARLEELLAAADFRTVRATHGSPEWKAALPEAEIALLSENLYPELFDSNRLRWIHCGQAGVDAYLPSSVFETGKAITTASGRSRAALAEHALAMMMALAHDHRGLDRYRAWRQWKSTPPTRRRALIGRSVGIIGVGNTGATLAGYCSALGMRVLAWRRSAAPHPAGVHQGFSAAAGDSLSEMLAACEFLVVACPLNNASRHLIGARELAALPRGAFLVNVGRGLVVDEQAMLAALRAGHLGGAGLDVFAREPLPPRHPLWRMPNVLISPHTPPRQSDREERHVGQIASNLRRFRAGEPLQNQLTLADAYDPAPERPLGYMDRAIAKALRVLYRVMGPA